MKKLITFISLSLLGTFAVYAQAVATNSIGSSPDAIDGVISFVLGLAASIPAIGSYIPTTLKILGIVSVSLTAISAVLMALAPLLNKVGLVTVAGYIQKILPYVQYASMFNVQK